MNLPADAAARLAKLIPMLGSDNDGEVVATVRALRRVLAASGSDLHALAALITKGGTAPPQPSARPDSWGKARPWDGKVNPFTYAAQDAAEAMRRMHEEAARRDQVNRNRHRAVTHIDRLLRTPFRRVGSTRQDVRDYEVIARVPWGFDDWQAVVDAAAHMVRLMSRFCSEVDRMFVQRVVMETASGNWQVFNPARRARLVEIMLGMSPNLPHPFAHEKAGGDR